MSVLSADESSAIKKPKTPKPKGERESGKTWVTSAVKKYMTEYVIAEEDALNLVNIIQPLADAFDRSEGKVPARRGRRRSEFTSALDIGVEGQLTGMTQEERSRHYSKIQIKRLHSIICAQSRVIQLLQKTIPPRVQDCLFLKRPVETSPSPNPTEGDDATGERINSPEEKENIIKDLNALFDEADEETDDEETIDEQNVHIGVIF
jgi:hypothetical protein